MENVLITGGTGLLGKHLTDLLLREGYTVNHLSRSKTDLSGKVKVYHWDIDKEELSEGAIRDADHVVHLSGASVASSRWTKKRKAELYASRIGGANLLLSKMKSIENKVATFLSASAVGYYGDGGERWLTEQAPRGKDFLANLCSSWEQIAFKAQELGKRTVVLRIGIVLSHEGGALPQLARSMNFGAAVYMGDGSQYLSWIHIDDLCRIFLHAIQNKEITGIYNAVAPNPVTNRQMISAIKKAKGSFALTIPAPVFALKLMLGEMSGALLAGQRCSSEKLQHTGFEFQYPLVERALENIYT